MTIEIHLSEDLINQVDERARNAGLGREAYVQEVLAREVASSRAKSKASCCQRAERDRQEIEWLAANRNAFAGKWVALEGGNLLAAGATAKEVFARVRGRSAPPLVVQVDEEDLPFAGW